MELVNTSSATTGLLGTLRTVRDGLEGIIRWQKFVGHLPVRQENCLEHTLDAVLVAIIVAEIVRAEAPQRHFDAYRLVACAAIHDFGEVHTGDIAYADRQGHHAIAEAVAFDNMFAWAPAPLRAGLRGAYAVQGLDVAIAVQSPPSDPTTTELFEFVERFGYLLYALEQVEDRSENGPLLTHVVFNQIDRLSALTRQFPELKLLLPDDQIEELRAFSYEQR